MWSQPNSKVFPVLPSQWTSAGVVLSPFWGTQGQDFGVFRGRVLGQEGCDSFSLLTRGDPPSPWRSLCAQRATPPHLAWPLSQPAGAIHISAAIYCCLPLLIRYPGRYAASRALSHNHFLQDERLPLGLGTIPGIEGCNIAGEIHTGHSTVGAVGVLRGMGPSGCSVLTLLQEQAPGAVLVDPSPRPRWLKPERGGRQVVCSLFPARGPMIQLQRFGSCQILCC